MQPHKPIAAPIQRIVILGGGTAGWMAASALSKALSNLGTNITVVESDEIGTVGVGEATVPSIHAFNALLGLPIPEFLERCQATIKLGISFENWGALGRRYMHAFSPYGVSAGPGHFDRIWLKHANAARARGETLDIDDCNIGSLAARASKFGATGNLPQSLIHAYHFDAALYGQYLRGHAEARGVTRIEGKVEHVIQDPETGFIQTLVLQSGQAVAGDFFIDCSGFNGLLIEKTLKAGYDSWAHWLPCDRAIAVPSENAGSPALYTRSKADEAGWMWRIPLQHRAGNGYVYASAHTDDDRAEARLLAQLDGMATAAPRRLRFTTGRRKTAWSHNCLALGLAAGFLEPLESTSIHLIQTSIFRLLSLFPDTSFAPAEIDEFNRQTAEEYEDIRDFLIAHYKATQRDDTPFWAACRDMAVPDRVNAIIGLFAANGRLTMRPEHLFSTQSWLAILLGQGGLPKGYDPLLRPMPDTEAARYVASVQARLNEAVRQMPDYGTFLAAQERQPHATAR